MQVQAARDASVAAFVQPALEQPAPTLRLFAARVLLNRWVGLRLWYLYVFIWVHGQAATENAAALLVYSLEDIIDEDADSVRQLQGVPVLLMPGTIHLIGPGHGAGVYVLSSQEQQLLASQPELLVSSDHLTAEVWSRYLPGLSPVFLPPFSLLHLD